MKRLLAICVCFFMCVGLCSCDSSQTRSVSSYNWSLEFITDLDGNMLFSGSVHDDIPVLDLTLSFEEKSFILTDNTHKQEWTGTYSLEKIDNSSSKLGLTFENLEEPVTGVYGTRVYSDDSESATITLQTDGRLAEIMNVLTKYRLEPKRMQLVYPYIDREPNMVLIEALKGGNSRVTVEPPLIVYKEPGVYTENILKIYDMI